MSPSTLESPADLNEPVDPCPTPSIACFLAKTERVPKIVMAIARRHFAMKCHVFRQLLVKAAPLQQIP